MKILFIFLLFVSGSTYSQVRLFEKTDKFTGIKTVTTGSEALNDALGLGRVTVDAKKIIDKDEPRYVLYFNYTSKITTSADGRSVIIKFADSSISTFANKAEYNIMTRGSRGYHSIILSESEAKDLLEKKITDVRIELRGYNIDAVVKRKSQDLISDLLKALIEYK